MKTIDGTEIPDVPLDVLTARFTAIIDNVELSERHFHEIAPAMRVCALAKHPSMAERADAAGLLTGSLKTLVVDLASKPADEFDVIVRDVCAEVARSICEEAEHDST
jgi:hypothetical protein